MAIAVNTLFSCFITPSSSSLVLKHKPQFSAALKRCVSSSAPSSYPSSSPLEGRTRKAWRWTALEAVVDERHVVAQGINGEQSQYPENDNPSSEEEEQKNLGRPCEVYVCNLPRSYDAAQLLDMFKPHGTILSVQVCRNVETGESKGCGYITMGSMNSARNAVAALDGSDVDGRKMRVRFSVEMNHGRRDLETLNSSPNKFLYYEAPHKLYVGNIARAVRTEELRNLFSRFGTVMSARVLHDLKQGKSRVYAFLSFLSEAERDSAVSLNGTEFCGRTLVVREAEERTEP